MFNSHAGLWKSTGLKRLLAESLFIFLLDCLRFLFFKGKQDVSTVDWPHWKSFMIQKPDNVTHWMCAGVGVRGAIASPTRHASSFFWLTLLGQQQICEGHMQRKGQQPRMASSEVIHATPRPRPNTNLKCEIPKTHHPKYQIHSPKVMRRIEKATSKDGIVWGCSCNIRATPRSALQILCNRAALGTWGRI